MTDMGIENIPAQSFTCDSLLSNTLNGRDRTLNLNPNKKLDAVPSQPAFEYAMAVARNALTRASACGFDTPFFDHIDIDP
jgi:hypothetical protein